jgi:fructokinase
VILVCGEALIDLTQTDDPGIWRAHPGGSPLNVAVGLARLGSPTGFVGRMSSDAVGRQLRKRLSDNGVDTSYVVAATEPTSLAVVSVDDEGIASYVFHMSGTADWQWSPGELPVMDGVDALQAGSLALLQPPGGEVLEAWLASSRGRIPVCVDPNVRPSVQPDRNVYRAAVDRWLPLADVFKASSEDIGWLYPGEDVTAVAGRWLAAGPSVVAITLGAAGALVTTRQGSVVVPGQSVEVVDTVGAGDAFTSGFLHQLRDAGLLTTGRLHTLSDADAEAAARFAVGIAADTCTRAGADPPRSPSERRKHP